MPPDDVFLGSTITPPAAGSAPAPQAPTPAPAAPAPQADTPPADFYARELQGQAIRTIVPAITGSPIAAQLADDAYSKLALKWAPELAALPPALQRELVQSRLHAEHPDVKPLLKPAAPLSANDRGYQAMAEHQLGGGQLAPAAGFSSALSAQSQGQAAPTPAAPQGPADPARPRTPAELNELGYQYGRKHQFGTPIPPGTFSGAPRSDVFPPRS